MTTYYLFLFKDQLKFYFLCNVISIYPVKINLSQTWTTVPIYNTSLIVLALWILYYSYDMHILPTILDYELLIKVKSIFSLLIVLYYLEHVLCKVCANKL